MIQKINRIKLFLFDPSYINFTNVDFDLLPIELLLLNSHIIDEYFNSLNQGSYIANIPYELAKSTTKIGNNKNITMQNINNKYYFPIIQYYYLVKMS